MGKRKYLSFTENLINEAYVEGSGIGAKYGLIPENGYYVASKNIYTGPYPEHRLVKDIEKRINEAEGRLIKSENINGFLTIDVISYHQFETFAIFEAKRKKEIEYFDCLVGQVLSLPVLVKSL